MSTPHPVIVKTTQVATIAGAAHNQSTDQPELTAILILGILGLVLLVMLLVAVFNELDK